MILFVAVFVKHFYGKIQKILKKFFTEKICRKAVLNKKRSVAIVNAPPNKISGAHLLINHYHLRASIR